MLENYKDVLTIQDIIEILPVGRTSIYKLIKNGKLKHLKIGKKIIIPKKFLIDFLENCTI